MLNKTKTQVLVIPLQRKLTQGNEMKKITKGKRDRVWYNQFIYEDFGKCPIKHCKNIIDRNSFQCGHIISEYNL